LFNPEVCQFVVNVVVVVNVIVGVIVFVGVNFVVVVALLVVDWGSATVAAGTRLSFCKHRERVAVLVGV